MTPPMRVLVLGSYPCIQPLHGGQIRLAAVIAAYRAAGFEVVSANLFDHSAPSASPRGAFDFDFPRLTPFRLWQGRSVPLIDDLLSGNFAANDPATYQQFTTLLEQHPDVIHLEQPWLLPLVRKWREAGLMTGVKLVYGSQNVEAPLKKAILEQYKVAEATAVAEEIATLETEACALSDIVLAVSDADRITLSRLSDTPVILAANGISPWQPTEAALERWRKRLSDQPFALFVGSAHPPNIAGFFHTFGTSLGFLPPDRKICVAGSVGENLLTHPDFLRWQPLNQSRLQVLGVLSDEDLAAIKSLAHVFILPITEGAGSNIKTAEAMYSGRYVLGTPTSFRGYEQALSLPGVHVAETPREFRKTLAALLQAAPLQTDAANQVLRNSLLWENTLAPMATAVKTLCRPGSHEEATQ